MLRRCRRCLLLAIAIGLAPVAAAHAQTPEPAQAPLSRTLSVIPKEHGQFGAIAFTPDGSFSSVWKSASKAEAEGKVRDDCTRFARGTCQVVSFRAELCAALATFQGGKDLKVTYAGGGLSSAEAQKSALDRCKSDDRSRGRCELRTVVCGDGRASSEQKP